MLTGDPNNPNGGAFERFTGLYIPVLGVTFNGATPPNSPYPTAIYTNQYDGVGDFPQYPLNVVSDANAVMGFLYGQHDYVPWFPDSYVQLPTSPGYTGNTTYYMSLDPTVPRVDPLRDLPAPYGNALADLLQPDTRVIVDMGYGSGEYANLPTPASLVELPDLFTIVPDLVTGSIQGPQAALVDLGVLPASDAPTGYPATPVLDPNLNFPLPQSLTTGVSVLTTAEGILHPGNTTAQSAVSSAVSSVTTQISSVTAPATPAVSPVTSQISSVTAPATAAVSPVTTPIKTAVSSVTAPATPAVSPVTTPIKTAVSSVTTPVNTAISSVTTPVRTAVSSVTIGTGGSKPVTAAVSKPTTPAAVTSTPTIKPAAGHGKKH